MTKQNKRINAQNSKLQKQKRYINPNMQVRLFTSTKANDRRNSLYDSFSCLKIPIAVKIVPTNQKSQKVCKFEKPG